MPKSRRYIVTVEFYVRSSSETRAQQIVEKEIEAGVFDLPPFGGEPFVTDVKLEPDFGSEEA